MKARMWHLLLGLIGAVVFCGWSDLHAQKAPKEIVIGVINSMTGMNAMTGAEQRWAYRR